MTTSRNNQQLLGALYVRSASSFQSDAYNVDEQRFQVEKYALQDDVQIVKTYEDIGISGINNPKQRPGLSTLLEDASKGEFNVLYITGLDRLSRRIEHVNDIVGQLQAIGVKIKISGKGEVTLLE